MLCLPLLAGGCQLFGVAAHVYGPPPVKPRYIPQKRPMVVYVQALPDPSGHDTGQTDALARAIESQLHANDVAPIVPSLSIAELRSNRPQQFVQMRPDAIARAVGAQQLLWVNVLECSFSPAPGSGVFRGQISLEVRVLDATDGRQLWPDDSPDGAEVTCQTPMLRAADHINTASVQRDLYLAAADQVAKLFYRHKPD
jgi:hypothetical protein